MITFSQKDYQRILDEIWINKSVIRHAESEIKTRTETILRARATISVLESFLEEHKQDVRAVHED